jgi:hypothetical protein
MVSSLQEVNSTICNAIDNAMFLRQSSRPCISIKVFQWLWFAYSLEGITHNRFNQFESAQGRFAVCFHPIF